MPFCPGCGAEVVEGAKFCPECGHQLKAEAVAGVKKAAPGELTIYDLDAQELLVLRQEVERRKKSAAATWILWLFLGVIGGHRFYLENFGRGIAMFLTLGGLGIWYLIDAFFIPRALRRNEENVQQEVLLEIAAMRERKQS